MHPDEQSKMAEVVRQRERERAVSFKPYLPEGPEGDEFRRLAALVRDNPEAFAFLRRKLGTGYVSPIGAPPVSMTGSELAVYRMGQQSLLGWLESLPVVLQEDAK